MTATNPPPLAERPARRTARARAWWVPIVLLTFAPKCVMCVLGYAGLGVALGLTGPELCGAPGSSSGPWLTWVSALGLATGAVFSVWIRRGTGLPTRDDVRRGFVRSAVAEHAVS